MAGRHCSYIKPDGSQCSGYAIKDSEYCLFHDPDRKDEVQAYRIRGGRHKSKHLKSVITDEGYVLDGIPAIEKLTQDVINKVLKLELDHQRASCIGRLATVYLKCQEVAKLDEIELRLKAIEAEENTPTRR